MPQYSAFSWWDQKEGDRQLAQLLKKNRTAGFEAGSGEAMVSLSSTDRDAIEWLAEQDRILRIAKRKLESHRERQWMAAALLIAGGTKPRILRKAIAMLGINIQENGRLVDEGQILLELFGGLYRASSAGGGIEEYLSDPTGLLPDDFNRAIPVPANVDDPLAAVAFLMDLFDKSAHATVKALRRAQIRLKRKVGDNPSARESLLLSLRIPQSREVEALKTPSRRLRQGGHSPPAARRVRRHSD